MTYSHPQPAGEPFGYLQQLPRFHTRQEYRAAIAMLPPDTRLHLAGMVKQRLQSRWCPMVPTPAQAAFLSISAEEKFFGGSTGPGKSTTLMMAVALAVEIPGISCLMLRRTYGDLQRRGGLLDTAHKWWGATAAHYNSEMHRWEFPNGSTIEFGYLESDRDVYRYQGAEYQLIAIDELTQFVEWQYLELFARLRRLAGFAFMPSMLSASNPGNTGHQWVRRRFVRPGSPDRPYLPARMHDNPYLDTEQYLKMLSKLPPVRQQQFINGDWDAAIGGGMFDVTQLVLEPVLPRNNWTAFGRGWDLAATEPTDSNPNPDWTAGVRMGLHADGSVWILNVVRMRARPNQVKQAVLSQAGRDHQHTQIFMEQEPGASGKTVIEAYTQALRGYDFQGVITGGANKVTRAVPLAQYVGAGNVHVLDTTWTEDFLTEMEQFPISEKKDQVDAAALVFNGLTVGFGEAYEEADAELTAAWQWAGYS